jgi:hypothetical protein
MTTEEKIDLFDKAISDDMLARLNALNKLSAYIWKLETQLMLANITSEVEDILNPEK